ncbi:MAG: aminodeoxychorismate/anthranilate synthase component II [Myxococcales bacterium]|nr:aminodeoxychorismate/anthranilate synthase component II [Myxococcales bacterium]
MRILIIDNYDSFTYNLVQYLGELGAEVDVQRNDSASVSSLLDSAPQGLVISPGPGVPKNAGISIEAVQRFGDAGIPVLGVCLGHQSIGEAYGGKTVRARTIMHGKTSQIEHQCRGVFAGLPQPFDATRYHSLVIEEASLPAVFEITARTQDGEIMGVRHTSKPVEGVQFHPESILTLEGKALLTNFLDQCRSATSASEQAESQ